MGPLPCISHPATLPGSPVLMAWPPGSKLLVWGPGRSARPHVPSLVLLVLFPYLALCFSIHPDQQGPTPAQPSTGTSRATSWDSQASTPQRPHVGLTRQPQTRGHCQLQNHISPSASGFLGWKETTSKELITPEAKSTPPVFFFELTIFLVICWNSFHSCLPLLQTSYSRIPGVNSLTKRRDLKLKFLLKSFSGGT